MDRIYHPYHLWEEVQFDMWGSVKQRDKYLKAAIDLSKDHKRYGSYMKRVVENWKYSCEHNLTNLTQNRKAWLGHAAASLAIGCPEDIMREAWGYLTQGEQDAANAEAEKYIREWEERHEHL